MRIPKNWHPPIEYQVLELQQLSHRAGWEQGKRETILWAIEVLRKNGYPVASDYLEGLVFGQATSGVQSSARLQQDQHEKVNQTQEAKAPDTSVVWSDHESRRTHEADDETRE